MKAYQSYLFDLDGTLIDTIDLIVACFNQSLQTLGVTKSKKEIVQNIGLSLQQQFELLLKKYPHKIDYDALMEYHMDYQLQIWQQYVKPYKNVESTLTYLKNDGKKLAIVTSRRSKSATLYLQAVNLLNFFDVIITPENTTYHKPHPSPALKALSKLKTKPQHAVFIGDSNFDMLCATQANIDTYFVYSGVGTLNELSVQPNYSHSDISLLKMG